MAKHEPSISAADFLPKKRNIASLRSAAAKCEGCHLYKNATQTVFGAGSDHAELFIVGEIPGNKEDIIGEPFVGPAGTLLRNSIAATDLDIEDIYFTNVVKHFKFSYLNKRRMHRSPIDSEIKACKPWLEAEIDAIQPKVILCLGAVAAKALVSKKFKITTQRGKWFAFPEHSDIKILVTFHPSAILRAIDSEARHRMKKLFVNDIKKVAIFLARFAQNDI